jgi:hypothetical protein
LFRNLIFSLYPIFSCSHELYGSILVSLATWVSCWCTVTEAEPRISVSFLKYANCRWS